MRARIRAVTAPAHTLASSSQRRWSACGSSGPSSSPVSSPSSWPWGAPPPAPPHARPRRPGPGGPPRRRPVNPDPGRRPGRRPPRVRPGGVRVPGRRARAHRPLPRPAGRGRHGRAGVGGRTPHVVVASHGANARGEDGTPSGAPRRSSPGLTAVKEVAQTGDFEAVVGYGIGLDRRRPITVSTLSGPPPLVIDVSTAGTGAAPAGTGDDSGSLPFTGSRTRTLVITAFALLA